MAAPKSFLWRVLGLAFVGIASFAVGLFFDELRLLLEPPAAEAPQQPSRGLWRTAEPAASGETLDPQLEALPYLAGYEPPAGSEGVTVNVPGQAEDGYNLVLSAHESEALLLDMDGRSVHRWRLAPHDTWSEHRKPPEVGLPRFQSSLWRAIRLLPEGDLLAIYEGLGLVRLDARSQVRWARWAEAHHAMHVLEDGRIWVLERQLRDSERSLGPRQIIEDQLTLLDGDGQLLRQISLSAAYAASPWSPLTLFLALHQNPWHSNSIRQLPGGHPLAAFAEGHLLISMRGLNAVAVIDPESEKVVWSLAGRFERQHDAQLLDNGNLLVFDNRPSEFRSRVVEIDPMTLEVAWEFAAPGFFSDSMGGAQRLPGGNTLVVESTRGRAFEVTPEGQVIWEWRSPYRVPGENGQELVATLFDFRRHPRVAIDAWLAPP